MNRAALAAAALFLAACGRGGLRLRPGERGEVVEAEGWAPIDEADALGTKRRSLADAEKKAVETVVGVYVSAKSRVDQTVTIDQRIMAGVDGYIRRYEVLGEKREDGFLKTRIRAAVLYQKLGDDLERLGLTKTPPPGNPRVAVTVAGGPAAGAAVRKAFLAAGYAVVDDPAQSDLLVRGAGEAHRLAVDGLGGLQSSRARLTLEVVKTKSGEILTNLSQEASGLDVSDDAAAAKALAVAGADAGDALVKKLAAVLGKRMVVAVRVTGLKDLAEVRRVADDVRLNPGVDAATLSGFRDGAAEFRVTTDDISGGDLAALIVGNKKLGLTAVSATAYAAELRKP